MNLLDVLATDTPVTWFIARVERVNAKSLDLVMGDRSSADAVRMTDVPYLASYSPAVDDVVHGIAKTTIGALVLGKPA